jgi:hypothetical protein
MNIFSLQQKRRTPAAQALVDGIRTKLTAATTKLAKANTDLEILNVESEVPEGEGLVVKPQDIVNARKVRTAAQDDVDRLAGALAEAERRLTAAQEVDAEAELTETWAEVGRTARTAEQQLDAVVQALDAAYTAAAAYLLTRTKLTTECPAFNDRVGVAGMNLMRGMTEREGYDRLLRLVQLKVNKFHPDWQTSLSSSHSTEIPELVKRERTLLRLLKDRDLGGPQAA